MQARFLCNGDKALLRAMGGPLRVPRFESRFWALPDFVGFVGVEILKTSSHLSPPLDGVCGLMHLPRVPEGRVVEPVDQLFNDVPVGAL